jgi:lipopolysaccharide export system permease protein
MTSINQQKPEMIIKDGVFSNDMPNYSIKVDHKSKSNNMLYDVMIYDHSDDRGNVKVTIADSGKMEMVKDKKYMAVTLFHGHSYTDEKENRTSSIRRYPFSRESFQKEVININTSEFEFNRVDEKRYSGASKMMGISRLSSFGDSLFKDYKIRLWRFMTSLNYTPEINHELALLANPKDSVRVNAKLNPANVVDFEKIIVNMSPFEKEELYRRAVGNARNNSQVISQQIEDMYTRKKYLNNYPMEWHRKFTLSFACLIFFFIGAPLGAIIRKGGLGMPVVVSILMFIAYYILMITGEKFAREDAWSMAEGMWLSSFVFLPLGIWLTYKAATDSGVMNIESYQLFFKKLLNLKFLKRNKSE